jgi:hypothetical protein
LSLPPQLEPDIETLRKEGYSVAVQRDSSSSNRIFIVLKDYPLPRGWNKPQARLLLIADVGYPNSKLDMFWVDADLLLEGGRVPQAADVLETYMGETWRRFSWHVQYWNPARDTVLSYLETVNHRLRQLS